MDPIFQLLCTLVNIYYFVLIVRIIFSWIPNIPEPIQPLATLVSRVTDPVLDKFRGLLPAARVGNAALDLSPILLFLLLAFIVAPLVCAPAGSLFGGGRF